MRVLVAPLNWGLGHASRCIPLIHRLQAEGQEVLIGGDGESLTLLRRHFPSLRVLPLAPLRLRYGRGSRQVLPMLRALPALIRSAIVDHRMLAEYLRYEQIDQVISDNRFGLYSDRVQCIYMTHQLLIPMPRGWRWLESIVAAMHRRVIRRFAACWVPDYPDDEQALAGRLSHPDKLPENEQYIGPLSRFAAGNYQLDTTYKVVAVLSGLEPQRTLLEKMLIRRYENTDATVLIVRGMMQAPPTVVKHGKLTLIPWLDDNHLAAYLLGAERIICRSGYSSVMDMSALGVLEKVEWHPTPGQPEQEYLYDYLKEKN